MSRTCRWIGLLSATLVLVWNPSSAPADIIKLNNGGEIRGEIDWKARTANDGDVTIETLSGAVVVVEREHIRFAARRSLTVEEYETRARQTPPTVEAQWELAEWCREQGLRQQREEQLLSIVDLDPEHEEARRALGHSKRDGEWMTRDEYMQAQGYVKHKGRYITPQELEVIEKTQAQLDAEREWFPDVRRWSRALTGRNERRRRQALAELQNIDDPNAVAALTRNLQEDPNQQVRALYVQILSGIPGQRPVGPLVAQSLHDSDREIRYRALNALSDDQYPAALPLYVRELKHDNNRIVRRAAAALERVGDDSAVPTLINALTTTHRYRVRVPEEGGLNVGIGMDATFAGGAGRVVLPPQLHALLASGRFPHGAVVNYPLGGAVARRTRVVTVKHEHRNSEALSALRQLTGAEESFGYDKRSWRLWWTSQKTGTDNAPTLP